MKYTEEEKAHMLAYANKYYPKGTEFECSRNEGDMSRVKNEPLRFYYNNNDAIDAFGIRFIYYEGKWARLVNDPQPPPYIPLGTIINYEIY